MTGQAREEEEEDMNDGCNTCGIRQLMEKHRGNQKGQRIVFIYLEEACDGSLHQEKKKMWAN